MATDGEEDEFCENVSRYVGVSGARRAAQRLCGVEARFNNVMRTGHLSEEGFSEIEIEAIINKLALMDSNNWCHSTGVGEREGRILLDLVRRRHFGLAHGIGRSGDITAIQPKATGSSLINRLTNSLLLDWLRRSGAPSTEACLLVPMATGMTLTLCLLNLKRRRGPQAKYVIWPRIDQKSCLKCIVAAGLVPIPIEPIRTASRQKPIKKNRNVNSKKKAEENGASEHADQLSSNLGAIELAMLDPEGALRRREGASMPSSQGQFSSPGPESIVCVLSTTTCFAPRVPDRLPAITRLCKERGIPHLVNNAYGVQSKRCMRLIESAWTEVCKPVARGRMEGGEGDVDVGGDVGISTPLDLLYVQSTDKNLMVPVGGAIIAGFSKSLLKEIAESYPGRASGTPTLDVFATLLHLGHSGWEDLLAQREACYLRLTDGLRTLAAKHGLRLMETPENPISLALSLHALHSGADTMNIDPDTLTQLGANLFTQGCSGVRVVVPAAMERQCGLPAKVVAGVRLEGFNSHSAASTEAYMNAAAALGQTSKEVDVFLSRLDKALSSFQRRQQQRQQQLQDQNSTE
ncbi:O-phosphoseryl-tRNA Sec selenium transferase [Taenia crassiceps]|uniref:O-phosphoseryl-tRNA(Sec) selenium transferase n=1 Tax=Taenia crassiceps TaxID=6207 RepID=A0ABR4Q003_9CEST